MLSEFYNFCYFIIKIDRTGYMSLKCELLLNNLYNIYYIYKLTRNNIHNIYHINYQNMDRHVTI
jgi:hypothetical protein